MNKKQNTFTILAAILFLSLGIFGIRLIYGIIFHPETTVNEQLPLSQEVEKAPDNFIASLKIPEPETSKKLTREQISDHIIDSYLYVDNSLYEQIFTTANIPYEDKIWSHFSGSVSESINGNDEFILSGNFQNGDNIQALKMLFRSKIPVAFSCDHGYTPTENQMQEAVAKLNDYAESPNNSPIELYIQQIDLIYQNCPAYQQAVTQMQLASYTGNDELSSMPTLWECCGYGTWQVYSGCQDVMILCTIGSHYLTLYYDAAAQNFVGYYLNFFSPNI